MSLDKKLLDILVCPACKGKLEYDKIQQRLICRFDKLIYPIDDGIPVMLVDEAEHLNEENR
ncbi:MAG: Trm112 family protein [Legionellales bacterium]|nr:Trm112 family protein [Legionellales bacterium]